MSQVHWAYEDQGKRLHEVSIYHGDSSGHVLIYCNTSIVKIDFGVFDSRNYSFMIDNELFQVEVVKTGIKKYNYNLIKTNKSEPIPISRIARNPEQEAKTIILIALAFITLISAGIIFYFGR